jgi:DNA-binding XRE family transcriptional regulator
MTIPFDEIKARLLANPKVTAEYIALAPDASEDAMTARIVDSTGAKITRGEDVALPAAVWDAIERGEHPVRTIRQFRGLTQSDVAQRAGLRQGYIADIEAGKKTGSATSLKAIAAALGVPLDILVG